VTATSVYVASNCSPKVTFNDSDYSKWLGPKWREELKNYKKVAPTIVTNHSSILDILGLMGSHWQPGFVAKEELRHSPVGPQTTASQGLYVARDFKSKEES